LEVGKTFPLAAGLVGDAATVLKQLVADAGRRKVERPTGTELAERRAQWRSEFEHAALTARESTPIEVETLLYEVQRVLPKNAVILAGSGVRHQVGQFYEFTEPGTHLVASGHGTMGWITAAALGAKIGSPGVPVVALAGDGDFRSLSETVGVAVEAGEAPIWVVLNNASYNVIGLYQKRHYGRTLGAYFEVSGTGESYTPDYAKLAESYGALGLRASDAHQVGPALEEAMASGRPTVIDVPVTPAPRYRASGHWRANRYLANDWNVPAADDELA
jgi:acetolactate synthase-1/2/3 large subunit